MWGQILGKIFGFPVLLIWMRSANKAAKWVDSLIERSDLGYRAGIGALLKSIDEYLDHLTERYETASRNAFASAAVVNSYADSYNRLWAYRMAASGGNVSEGIDRPYAIEEIKRRRTKRRANIQAVEYVPDFNKSAYLRIIKENEGNFEVLRDLTEELHPKLRYAMDNLSAGECNGYVAVNNALVAAINPHLVKLRERGEDIAPLSEMEDVVSEPKEASVDGYIEYSNKSYSPPPLWVSPPAPSVPVGNGKEYPYNKEYEKTFRNGKGRVVLEGVHRYIETSNGDRIDLYDYDEQTGVGSDSSGKKYKIEGGALDRQVNPL